MPMYRFKCNACREEFEDFRWADETEEFGDCLGCGSSNIRRKEMLKVLDGGPRKGEDLDRAENCNHRGPRAS